MRSGKPVGVGMGLSRLSRLDRREAIHSVPKLVWNESGCCVLEKPTRKQLTGLAILAKMPDRVILEETGREEPVWTLVVSQYDVTIVHNRRSRRFAMESTQ